MIALNAIFFKLSSPCNDWPGAVWLGIVR